MTDSDVSIGINQIRTFLDEFSKMKYVVAHLQICRYILCMTSRADQSKQHHQTRTRTLSEGSSSKIRLLRRKARREKEPDTRVQKGHHFVLQQLNVKMVCDQCNKVIGVLEKGEVCRGETQRSSTGDLFTSCSCLDCNYTTHDGCVKKVTQHCEGKVSDKEGDKEVPTSSICVNNLSLSSSSLHQSLSLVCLYLSWCQQVR